MAVKTCSACGSQVPEAALFCTQCGSRDVLEAATPAPPFGAPSEPNPWAAPPPPAPAPTLPVSAPPPPMPSAPAPSAPAPFSQAPPTFAAPPPPTTQATPPPIPHAEPTQVWSTAPASPPVSPPASPPVVPQFSSPPVAASSAPPAPMASPNLAPTPFQAPSTSASNAKPAGGRFGAFLALIGAGAALAGVFLPWANITPDGFAAISFGGWGLTNDAKIVAGIAGIAIVFAVIAIAGAARGFSRLVILLAGLGLVGLGAYETFDLYKKLPTRLKDLGYSGLTIHAPALGLILVLAGGGVCIVAALLMRAKKHDDAGLPGVPNHV